MEDWVLRALKRWPNVPALYGWLKLDRRGRWLIKGETISRLQIIDVFNRNYAADEHGSWYIQNGPQRGYVQLEYAPWILHSEENALLTHTGLQVEQFTGVFMDEEGALIVSTEHGPGQLLDSDLDWALQRMSIAGTPITAEQIANALTMPSGEVTDIVLDFGVQKMPVMRLDAARVPVHLSFVRNPELRENELISSGIPE